MKSVLRRWRLAWITRHLQALRVHLNEHPPSELIMMRTGERRPVSRVVAGTGQVTLMLPHGQGYTNVRSLPWRKIRFIRREGASIHLLTTQGVIVLR